jgi:hypothetical protein
VGERLTGDDQNAAGIECTARWQFTLWHIFVVTTGVGIAAAVARAFGLGTLAISMGLLVALLNWLGAFQVLQTGRRQSTVLVFAWLTFLVSLALPALEVFGPISGAEAAWAALVMPWEVITGHGPPAKGLLVFLAADTANLMMVLLPLGIWRLARGRGGVFCTILCLSMVAAWGMGWNSRMLVGYYVWSASFMIALTAIPIRPWTLAAIIALAVSFAVVVQ